MYTCNLVLYFSRYTFNTFNSVNSDILIFSLLLSAITWQFTCTGYNYNVKHLVHATLNSTMYLFYMFSLFFGSFEQLQNWHLVRPSENHIEKWLLSLIKLGNSSIRCQIFSLKIVAIRDVSFSWIEEYERGVALR